MGFGLYEAAFATAAGLYGRDARNAITGITLFAGFASTVGWPTSALFIDAFRLARRVPGLGGAASRDRTADEPASGAESAPQSPRRAAAACRARRLPWTMIVLAGVFGATWFVSTAMAAHLPRLLQAMGATPAAAIAAAALVGPAQVAARLVEFGSAAPRRRP